MSVVDPVGSALLALIAGDLPDVTIHRSDGATFPHRGIQKWVTPFPSDDPAENELLDRIQGPVLDLEAGAGRVSLALHERGISVLPMDPSSGCMKAMHLRGLEMARVGHGGEDVDGERFSAVLLLRGGIPFAGTMDRTREWFSELAEVAHAEGKLFVGSILPGWSKDPYSHPHPELQGFQMAVRSRIEHRGVSGPWEDRLFPSVDEMEVLLDGTGWVASSDAIAHAGGPAVILVAHRENAAS